MSNYIDAYLCGVVISCNICLEMQSYKHYGNARYPESLAQIHFNTLLVFGVSVT